SPASFDLAAGEVQPVRVVVSVPPDPEPGERYVGLLFRVPAPQSGASVAISGSIGAELLIQVPGTVTRKASLGALHAPFFADGGPVRFDLTVRDSGNVHRDYIRPHNLVALAHGDVVAFPDFTVLRDSTRIIQAEWPDPPLICICTL